MVAAPPDVAETATSLKLRDRDFIKNSETWNSRPKLQNLWTSPKFLKEMSSPLRSWIIFEFLAFFPPILIVSYLEIQQTKNSLNFGSFPQPYPCNIQSLKTSSSQTGATWLTKGGICNSWKEICSREELGMKSCRWKNLGEGGAQWD